MSDQRLPHLRVKKNPSLPFKMDLPLLPQESNTKVHPKLYICLYPRKLQTRQRYYKPQKSNLNSKSKQPKKKKQQTEVCCATQSCALTVQLKHSSWKDWDSLHTHRTQQCRSTGNYGSQSFWAPVFGTATQIHLSLNLGREEGWLYQFPPRVSTPVHRYLTPEPSITECARVQPLSLRKAFT